MCLLVLWAGISVLLYFENKQTSLIRPSFHPQSNVKNKEAEEEIEPSGTDSNFTVNNKPMSFAKSPKRITRVVSFTIHCRSL